MKFLAYFRSLAAKFLRRSQVENDMDEELRSHIQHRADDLERSGLPRAEAERRARIEFGGYQKYKEEIRESLGAHFLDTLLQDIRYAARMLRKSPGFTAVAVLTLALGIGANTAIFSLMDTVMFRLLPVQRPGELVQVGMMTHGFGRSPRTIYTNPLWESLRARQDIFAGIFAWGNTQFNLASSGVVEDARGIYVSGSYFPTLGVHPAQGRLIAPDDDKRGCPGVAVLGYGFWQQHFGGAPVDGRTISINGHPFEIIGVSAAGFFGAEVGHAFDVAAPICSEAIVEGKNSSLDQRSAWWFHVIARQKPEINNEQISARLAVLSPQIFAETVPTNWKPSDQKRFLGWTLTALPAGTGISNLRSQYDLPLKTLMAIAGFVLLLACTNIASLMLARAASRSKEIGVRLALGASRPRLVRQLLTESVLLSCSGALLGILFAQWGSRLVVDYISTGRDKISLDLTLDSRVLIFTAAAAILTGLLFGVLPAFRATRVSLADAMKGPPSTKTKVDARFRAGRWMVAAQLAISLVLVATTGLFVRSFANLVNLDAGFDRNNVLLANVDLHNAGQTGAQLATMREEMLRRVRTLPGVISASESLMTPISGGTRDDFIVVDAPNAPKGDDRDVYLNYVTPDYFATLRSRLIEGRDFNAQDKAGAPQIAIVNQALARKFYGGIDPVGRTFRRYETANTLSKPFLIVGVTGDAKYDTLREDAPPTAYFPLAQTEGTVERPSIEIRTETRAAQFAKPVEGIILGVNKSAAIQFTTLAQQVDDSLTQERLLATLSGFFGALALLLAMIGFYGVLAYLLLQRRKEIGIRMALGAQRGAILRLVMRDV
ncbi:MAG TPA: ABC transporter permease, partial [Candidatus Acidoferrales bacterium]|nr:ABC transporter permease [Candidatus Acidoferrales bacterium]